MVDLDGRLAVITGAASGIGRATALCMSQLGADIVVADINQSGAEAVSDTIRQQNGNALAIHCDVSKPDDLNSMIDTTLSECGRIDILVNNAADLGLLAKDLEFLTTCIEDWRAAYQANQQSVMLATQLVLPHMLQSGSGAIVNVSSVDGVLGDTTKIAYGMNKAAVNLFTRCIATAYGHRGIRCNAVLPGLAMTEMARANTGPREEKIWRANIRAPEPGTPEQIASVIAFLATDAASYINGELIRVDGGLLAHVPHLAQFESLAL